MAAMLQQNGQYPAKPTFPQTPLQNQHTFPSFHPNAGTPAPHPQDPTAFFGNLDASSSAAKQLAALNAAGIARRATQSGGTSGTFIGGMPPPSHHQLSTYPHPFRSDSASSHSLVSAADPSSLHHSMQAPPQTASANFAAGPTYAMSPSHNPNAQFRHPLQGAQAQNVTHMTPQVWKQRQVPFLQSLAKVMENRKTPLPHFVTGIRLPIDPVTTPWKHLEPASEIGGFKLAGKDIELFRLWTIVLQHGGSTKIQQADAWANLLPHFGLPERLPQPLPDGTTSTAQVLATHYLMILGPFEEAYQRNVATHQARLAQGQAGVAGGTQSAQQMAVPGTNMGNPFAPPQTPQTRVNPGVALGQGIPPPSSAGHLLLGQATSNTEPNAQSSTQGGDLEFDADGRKRKLGELDDLNQKRARRKTDSEPPQTASQTPTIAGASSPMLPVRGQPSRRKIEYVPLAREVEAGGRDVQQMQLESQRLTRGRALREINEWGTIHVEALMMSVRSRIATELSYALTTVTVLSTMRGPTPDSGFPIPQCSDLLDELLDLLEEVAFAGEVDNVPPPDQDDARIVTNHELIAFANEEGFGRFYGLKSRQGRPYPDHGHVLRPGDILRSIVAILRNFSAVTDNQAFMARHPTLVDLLLRLTSLAQTDSITPRPLSKALSVQDLIVIRKDILGIFANFAAHVALVSDASGQATPTETRRAGRVFELVASYVVDANEAVTPSALSPQFGVPPQLRAVLLPDTALEVFTKLSHPDTNRQVFTRALPESWIWIIFSALIRRLPVSSDEFGLTMREEGWLAYIERVILSLYSLAFIMPPALKRRVKSDRQLGVAGVLRRVVKRYATQSPQEYRAFFCISARRAIETMKIIDDGDDSFDAAQPTMPQLSFGVGYGEVGDERVEKGTGVWGSHREDLLWSVMLQRELDDVMFTELESLTRVDDN